MAKELWGGLEAPAGITKREYGRGVVYRGGAGFKDLFPDYKNTAALLKKMGVGEDFSATGPVRFGHRKTEDRDIYFVSNRTDKPIQASCTFRVGKGQPELWNPVNGKIRPLPQYQQKNGFTTIPMAFESHEGFFVIFPFGCSSKQVKTPGLNFPKAIPIATLVGPWQVSFDAKWGGPEKVTFEALQDWTHHAERGIKYYSGIATYRKSFDLLQKSGERFSLDLGTVHDIARVRLNGKDLGVAWCAPWRVDITDAVKTKGNVLEVEVANRWPNRLLGDQQAPDKDVRTVKWDSGFLGGREYKTGRYTFATSEGHNRLLPSGLLGPVRIVVHQK